MSVPAGPERLVVGIDVGGTKIVAGALRGGELLGAVEHPTDTSSERAVIAGIESAAREAIAAHRPPLAVGVGVPSQIDFATGRVLTSVNIPLAGEPLGEDLTRRLRVPVVVDNDANCAALAEAHLAGVDHLVMLTLGTGVGGGVVVDGRVFRGASGLGAELGHLVIETEGPECPGACPNRGCLEALCSGQALARDAAAIAVAGPESRLAALARERGGPPAGVDVVVAAGEGDADALRLFERFGTSLGVGMSGLMNAFEPELLAVGGGLSRVADLYLPRAVEEARGRALPTIAERVRIEVARGGPEAGLLGAARLAASEVGREGRAA